MLRSGVRPVPRSGSDAVSEWLHTELARAGVGMDAVPRVVDVVMPLLRAKDAEIARLRMAGEGTQVTVGWLGLPTATPPRGISPCQCPAPSFSNERLPVPVAPNSAARTVTRTR